MELKRFYFLLFLLLVGVFFSFNTKELTSADEDKFTVVLDAGHGGHDPGNLGNGYLEKNIALSIVLKAGALLEKHPDIEVIYTRKDDRFVDLYVRGEIANKANADLFVSVHCDSHTSNAHGAGTFVLGLHANQQNFEIAKKENSVIYLEDNYESRYAEYDINSPESVIGLTIMQEEFLEQSIMLAKLMQDNFSNRLKRNNRKVKQAGFIVLHQTFMPSVLVECGFLTNKNEGMYLNSKNGQAEMGKAIADAIVNYKNNLRPSTGAISGSTERVSQLPPKKEPTSAPAPVEREAKQTEVVVSEDPAVVEKQGSPKEQSVEVKKEDDLAEGADSSGQEPANDQKKSASREQMASVEKEIKKPQEIPAITQKPQNEPAEEDTATKEETKPVTPPKEVVIKDEPSKKAAKPKSNMNIIFKVQILASSKNIPLKAENFKGLNTLSKEPYKNLFRYMYGNTSSHHQAKLFQSNAVAKGYTTAYLVAYKDGVRIPVKEALKYVED